jgi:hypothetical protein
MIDVDFVHTYKQEKDKWMLSECLIVGLKAPFAHFKEEIKR